MAENTGNGCGTFRFCLSGEIDVFYPGNGMFVQKVKGTTNLFSNKNDLIRYLGSKLLVYLGKIYWFLRKIEKSEKKSKFYSSKY